ncbi:MAG: hypothetical protein AB7P02_01700 [Alphaproteobacteria bacterium]
MVAFYRIREGDGAQAVVGREEVEAANLADAIVIAGYSVRTLNMPQFPDAMTVTDGNGVELYSSALVSGEDGGPAIRPPR